MSKTPTVPRPTTKKEAQEVVDLWKSLKCDSLAVQAKVKLSRSAWSERLAVAMKLLGLDATAVRQETMKGDPEAKKKAEEVIEVWKQHHYTAAKAAQALNLAESSFRTRLDAALRLLGLNKAALVPAVIPEGMHLRKTTVQYGPDGTVEREWRRLGSEAEALEALAKHLVEQVACKAPKLPPMKPILNEDLMVEIPFFDAHFGKLCWEEETGNDYNSKVAYNITVGTAMKALMRVGTCGTGLLVIGGDFFHTDSRFAITERGGNPLDVDSRKEKVWEVATKALHDVIALMSQFCRVVKITVIPGNHDPESGMHLRWLLNAYYRHEADRIQVSMTPRNRHYIQHGIVLLGIGHGHLLAMAELPGLMALEEPAAWASSKERAWHLGHIHKRKSLRIPESDTFHSVEVEHLESISGADAWHHENGFIGSPRRTCNFVWHSEFGLRERVYVNVSEITDVDLKMAGSKLER